MRLHFFISAVQENSEVDYYFDSNLIKISLEIMLSDFGEQKETFFGVKKRIF